MTQNTGVKPLILTEDEQVSMSYLRKNLLPCEDTWPTTKELLGFGTDREQFEELRSFAGQLAGDLGEAENILEAILEAHP